MWEVVWGGEGCGVVEVIGLSYSNHHKVVVGVGRGGNLHLYKKKSVWHS